MDYSVFYRFLEGDDSCFDEMLNQLLPLLEQHKRAIELLKITTAAKGYIPVRVERRIERFLSDLEV